MRRQCDVFPIAKLTVISKKYLVSNAVLKLIHLKVRKAKEKLGTRDYPLIKQVLKEYFYKETKRSSQK